MRLILSIKINMNQAKDRLKRSGWAIGAKLEQEFLAIPESRRSSYKEEFFRELGKISIATRKEGEPPLVGVYELADLDLSNLDLPNSPTNSAKATKEAIHPYYTAPNKMNFLRGLYGYFGMTAPFDEKPPE